MIQYIKDNGRKRLGKDMEYVFGKMLVGTKGIGTMMFFMVKVNLIIMKETYIRGTLRVERHTGMEFIQIKMEHNLVDNLKMGKNMAWEPIKYQINHSIE